MNPFNPNEPARHSSFVSRRGLLELVARALEDGTAPLLLVGPPRMGKTSLILEAAGRLGNAAPALVRVDVTTASTLADVAGRILRSASLSAGSQNGDSLAHGLAHAVGVSGQIHMDPITGRAVAGVERAVRALPTSAQREVLTTTLDALNAMAAEGGRDVAIAIEGVERLAAIGGDGSLWQLREALGRQTHLRQILTTDDAEVARAGTEAGGPFADWGQTAQIAPISAKRLASWIRREARNVEARVTPGAAEEINERAGTRTGDVVRLAAEAFEQAGGQKVGRKHVGQAFDALSLSMSGWFRADWRALTPRQQNLSRALAAGENRPFTGSVRKQYDLRSSAAVARSLELLMQKGLVCRSEAGYAIDNPFFRRWVERITLPDIGPAR